MNLELKTLSRRKQREWVKYGKSDKYKSLDAQFTAKYEAAAKKFMENKVENLKEAEPGKAYRIFKTMGAQPGDCSDNHTFSLPNHQQENLSDQECAEHIAEHFARISREYSPLDIEKLPERVKARLRTKSKPPIITEYECYEKMRAAKKPMSGVPGGPAKSHIEGIYSRTCKPCFSPIEQHCPFSKLARALQDRICYTHY